MENLKKSIIAVVSEKNRAMGIRNGLLWKIPGDLPRFKRITEGHTVIMGRKTYESIGRPLPNRVNIVITRNIDFKPEGVFVVSSIEQAFELAEEKESEKESEKEEKEIFVIGGGEIYKQALPFVDRLYLTIVHDEPAADTFFPDYSEFTKKIFKEEHPESTPTFTYLTLDKQ